jgi:hypothetical protein
MEDNSAVVNVSNEESAYLKKCKHFIMMVVNYVREQLELGLIQVIKIKGKLNNADLHTKKLIRDKSFATKADNILGSPARLDNTSDSEAEADTEDEYYLTPSILLSIGPIKFTRLR